MSLRTTLDATRTEAVRHASRGTTYAEALARHASLAPFPKVGGLLAALDLGSPLEPAERAAVVTALAREAQGAKPHPLWQSLLLVAFAPMLRRLRARIGNPKSAEHDQRVLFAFLNALRTVEPGPHTALALRWATEKAVFGAIRKQRSVPEVLDFEEETCAPDLHQIEALEKAAVAEVARFVESECEEELVEVFHATTAGDLALKEYVARTYTGRTKKGLAAEYNRLCRARLRLVGQLRAHFRDRDAEAA
jgi:hypothetical protein